MPILRTQSLEFNEKICYPDISIEKNKLTFISGPSGCGKTTMLRLFNATAFKSNGSVFYDGKDIDKIDTIKLRREVLLASQMVYLFEKTIKENFDIYYNFRGEDIIDEQKIKEYLSICCCDLPLDAKCETMSGGERQRVFLALHISFLPKVLMLDEPTSMLDERTANMFFTNIKKFAHANNITLIVISHDDNVVAKYNDNIIKIG